ncbi:hypothetical protein F2Q69_00005586 [Brassica cretica]|uniref:Uncharacterized protein n=1 Tax=Brassica cretica TaxID=69181 RepID=A0A8S9PEF4_BRACR|nr:hypothetical protein F2Q69_00005586 [Brassica cretica]
MKGRSIWERCHHSDSLKSLVFMTFGCSKTLSERPPRATARSRSGPERHYHSDTSRLLVFVTFWNAKNGPGATYPERHPQVAREETTMDDVFGATRSGCSRRNDPGAMSSERHSQVAREETTQERPLAATPSSRSRAGPVYSSPPIHHFLSSKARLENAYLSSWVVESMAPMVKKTKGKSDAEKQEAERRESALRGKDLSSEQTGSETQRTSRQQTLAAKKTKEQERRAGKSVAVATDEESGDESADEQAPTKRA